MLQKVKEGAELLQLAEATQKHLQENGHEVTVETSDDLSAFTVSKPDAEEDAMIVRVQQVRDDSWEMVRPNGETLTGMGSEATCLAMIERMVNGPPERRGGGRR